MIRLSEYDKVDEKATISISMPSLPVSDECGESSSFTLLFVIDIQFTLTACQQRFLGPLVQHPQLQADLVLSSHQVRLTVVSISAHHYAELISNLIPIQL